MLEKRVQQARKERILIEIAEAYQGYDIWLVSCLYGLKGSDLPHAPPYLPLITPYLSYYSTLQRTRYLLSLE